jgi:hypothetical protein
MREEKDGNERLLRWRRQKTALRFMRLATLVARTELFALMRGTNGCSTTQQEQRNIIAKTQGAQTPLPLFSGFLGDYTLLQPGNEGQALSIPRSTGANTRL